MGGVDILPLYTKRNRSEDHFLANQTSLHPELLPLNISVPYIMEFCNKTKHLASNVQYTEQATPIEAQGTLKAVWIYYSEIEIVTGDSPDAFRNQI